MDFPKMPPSVPPPMSDDEYRREMQAAASRIIDGHFRRDRPTDNPSQFHGQPCKRCKGTLRYYSNRACVQCQMEKSRQQTLRRSLLRGR